MPGGTLPRPVSRVASHLLRIVDAHVEEALEVDQVARLRAGPQEAVVAEEPRLDAAVLDDHPDLERRAGLRELGAALGLRDGALDLLVSILVGVLVRVDADPELLDLARMIVDVPEETVEAVRIRGVALTAHQDVPVRGQIGDVERLPEGWKAVPEPRLVDPR